MIRVTRLSKPQILKEKAKEWTTDLCQERAEYYDELSKLGPHDKKPKKPGAKNSRYAHSQIVETLETMFHKKCAYCESKIKHITSEHVEHFRPQSIYPQLAYKWSNLLIACPSCNSTYKKAKFPLLPDGRQPKEDKTHPCRLDDKDQRAIINPCEDNPQDFLVFYDQYLAPLDQDRAKHTISVCQLNRPDLCDVREAFLERVRVAISAFKFAKECGNITRQREYCARLSQYARPEEPYTAMVKAKLQSEGIDLEEIWTELSTQLA